jgi:TRAP-type mannitol/chloroaromatic compound transport system substrate-binding protein
MKRRNLLTAFAASGLVAGCGDQRQPTAAGACSEPVAHWKMLTSWPLNFPGFGTAADYLARTIETNSGGRIAIQVYAAGELVPAFEVFDAVSRGTAELGHSAPVYWKGKIPAAQFFSGIPFGMQPESLNAWLYYGGGQALWEDLYAPFNLLPLSAGNTGPQMGGWFRREIHSIADLSGLKIRMPGLGAEVLKRAGATPVNIAGAELFTALQTGTIDATEWAGPYNDLAFGLHRVAPYYYHPGWHEPAGTLECLINMDALAALPTDLQAIVKSACRETNEVILAEFTARNQSALHTLTDEHGVQLRKFPDELLAQLKTLTAEVIEELAAADPDVARVAESYTNFQAKGNAWRDIS